MARPSKCHSGGTGLGCESSRHTRARCVRVRARIRVRPARSPARSQPCGSWAIHLTPNPPFNPDPAAPGRLTFFVRCLIQRLSFKFFRVPTHDPFPIQPHSNPAWPKSGAPGLGTESSRHTWARCVRVRTHIRARHAQSPARSQPCGSWAIHLTPNPPFNRTRLRRAG